VSWHKLWLMYFITLQIDFKKSKIKNVALSSWSNLHHLSLLNRSRRNIVKNKLCWTRTLNKKKSQLLWTKKKWRVKWWKNYKKMLLCSISLSHSLSLLVGIKRAFHKIVVSKKAVVFFFVKKINKGWKT